jgi:hypothetical protein
VDDAAALLLAPEVRVTYLDLRNATAAQALDWILRPARMDWWLQDDTVVAGTQRRRSGNSLWVYDTSLMSLPQAKEFEKLDYSKAIAAAKKAGDDFLAAVRTGLGVDEESLLWIGPGQLLLVGDPATHTRAAKLLAGLADPDARLTGAAAKVHEVTSRRAKERRELADKLAALRQKQRIAAKLEKFGWQLMAAAVDGQLDLESLTELQIAWKAPETKRMISGQNAAMPLWSLWVIQEAARALPDEAELQALAKSAAARCAFAVPRLRTELDKSPADPAVFTAVLYAALAKRSDSALRDSLRAAMAKAEVKDQPLQQAVVLMEALLQDTGSIDAEVLEKLVRQLPQGNDLVVLTALACRRAGGSTWQAFRKESQDILGKQALDGNVVVLVNRLEGSQLPLVAQ